MGFYLTTFVRLVLAFFVYKIVRNYLETRRLRKWGEQFGCGEAPAVPNMLPGGLERYKPYFTGFKGIDFLEDIIRKRALDMGCSTYRIFSTTRTFIHTSDPQNIQALLATKFQDFDLAPSRKQTFNELLGNGIFTSEGQEWSHFRHQLKPQFTRDQVSDLDSANHHLQILFKALPQEDASAWVQADLKPLFYNFTMDVSTEFLFGESVNSQTTALHALDSGNSTEAKEDMDFAEAMNFSQEVIINRIRLGKLGRLVGGKRFKKACATAKAFTEKWVSAALDPEKKGNARGGAGKEKYVFLNELVKETQDPIELRDQSLHLLLAGRDTTSALLCWVIVLLSRDPISFQKLRESIVSQFGTEHNPTNPLTFESLKACKELTYVINETLRLYPIVPFNARIAMRDTILPTGGGPSRTQPIVVRKGEGIGYATYVMHRDHGIWGPDADEFKPERWVGRKLGWEYIPFSGGPRVCIGQQYALSEASFVIVKLLMRYDRIEVADNKPIVRAVSLTLSPGDGVNVRLRRAAS